MNIEIEEKELIQLTEDLCKFAEFKEYPPDKFAIMLGMVSKLLAETQNLTVHGVSDNGCCGDIN